MDVKQKLHKNEMRSMDGCQGKKHPQKEQKPKAHYCCLFSMLNKSNPGKYSLKNWTIWELVSLTLNFVIQLTLNP